MRRPFLASFTLRTLAPLALAMGAACGGDEASRPPPERSWGAEVVLTVRGRGRVTSFGEPGLSCPGRCAGKVVPPPANSTAPVAITLHSIAEEGHHLVRWETEGAIVDSSTRVPPECNPIRRRTETPELGNSEDATLPFGDLAGSAPEGRFDTCVDYIRVPLAYSVTAVFEPEQDFLDRWASFPDNRDLLDLKVADDTLMARAVAGFGDPWDIVAYDQAGTVRTLATGISTDAFEFFGHHVIWQTKDGGMRLLLRGSDGIVQWSPMPSVRCLAVTTTSTHAYCRTNDFRLVRWNLDGGEQTTILSGMLPGAAMTASPDQVVLTTLRAGGWSLQRVRPGSSPAVLDAVTEEEGPLPLLLRADASYAYWLAGTSTSPSVFRAPLTSGVGAAAEYGRGSADVLYGVESSSSTEPVVFVATAAEKKPWRITAHAAGATTTFREAVDIVGSIAADAHHVYWTGGGQRIYRGAR